MILSDEQIIEKVLAGDVNLFEQLIDKYKDTVYKITSTHVPYEYVDEVANDIFFKCYKSLSSYRGDAQFVNWLSVISVRTCKSFWRDKYKDVVTPISSFDVDIDYLVDRVEHEASPEFHMLTQELGTQLSKALDQLKPSERMIINMLYSEGQSIAETASLMELTEANVKVIAHRAKKKLADMLKDTRGSL